jgi:hypothetical protein
VVVGASAPYNPGLFLAGEIRVARDGVFPDFATLHSGYNPRFFTSESVEECQFNNIHLSTHSVSSIIHESMPNYPAEF